MFFLPYEEDDAEGQPIYFLNTPFVGGLFEDTDFIAAIEYRRKSSQAVNQWAQDKCVVLVGYFNAPQDFSLKTAAFSIEYANSLLMFA